MKITFESKFQLFDTVYFKGRGARVPGIVTGISISGRSMNILYWVTWSNDLTERRHYGEELELEFTPDYSIED